MNTAVLNILLKIEDRKITIPTLKHSEILMHRGCGSDVQSYKHCKIGRFNFDTPIALGYKFVGEVVKVYENVTKVQVGDRVAVEPVFTYGHCDYCKLNRYNFLCLVRVIMEVPHLMVSGWNMLL